jgi:hypothetical protein
MTRIILLSALCLICVHGFTQCNYKMNQIDEFTGKKEQWLTAETVCKGIKIILAKIDSVYLLGAYGDLGCVTSDSNLYLKFEDGTVLKLAHEFKADCNSYQVVLFCNISDDIDDLKTKRIAKVRLTGTDRTFEGDFKNPEYIMTRLRECLNN